MARLTDINNAFKGVNWGGVDPDVIAFRDELYNKFPKLRVTSAKRDSKGRHGVGQAIDIGDDPEIQKFLYSSEGDALLKKYKLGFLDETLDHNLKYTKGTGPHFHIGKDSTLSGNKYVGNNKEMGNTAFNTDTYNPSGRIETPNNVNVVYDSNYQPVDTKFIENFISEQREREAMLQQEIQNKEMAANRQNAIQKKIKERMDEQASILDLIGSHNLDTVSRDRGRKFEEGGEFNDLDSNLKFKIETIKNSMPEPEYVDTSNMPEYKELRNVRDNINKAFGVLNEVYKRQPSPTITVNGVVGGVPQDSDEGINEGQKIESPASTTEKLYNELLSTGLKSYQVSGILGALSGESGINLNPMARNSSSGAFGIAQWLGGRLSGLKSFAKNLGRDFKNEDIQIKYLLHEIQNNESKAFSKVKQAKDISEATRLWTEHFERPSKAEIKNSINKRIKNAKFFQDKFS